MKHNHSFSSHSLRISVNLASPKLLCLGKKKKEVSLFCARLFVTLPLEKLPVSEMQRKTRFPFAFHSTFRNFAQIK